MFQAFEPHGIPVTLLFFDAFHNPFCVCKSFLAVGKQSGGGKRSGTGKVRCGLMTPGLFLDYLSSAM